MRAQAARLQSDWRPPRGVLGGVENPPNFFVARIGEIIRTLTARAGDSRAGPGVAAARTIGDDFSRSTKRQAGGGDAPGRDLAVDGRRSGGGRQRQASEEDRNVKHSEIHDMAPFERWRDDTAAFGLNDDRTVLSAWLQGRGRYVATR